MHVPAHSAQLLLRGDGRYNPRFTLQPEIRLVDGASRVTGLMKPDSPEGVNAKPALPDIPFCYIIPADAGAAEYQWINAETWRRLRSGESLWNLDFTVAASRDQDQQRTGNEILIASLALSALMILGSRN